MTRARPEDIEFTPGDVDELLDRMAAIKAAGVGWVNLRPVIDREHEPPAPGPLAIFGGSPHKVPVATWIPGKQAPDGAVKPTTVGLQHSSGPRVVARLRDLGLPLPEGWKVTQDHPRRGLVARLSADSSDSSDAEALDWLVRAGTALCAVPATGRWRASLHAGIR